MTGRPRFGSVRLRFGGGTVPAVPVFGSGGSSAKVVLLCFSTVQQGGTVPVLVSVPGKRFWRFWENGSGGSGSAFGFGRFKNGSDGSGFRSSSAPEPSCFERLLNFRGLGHLGGTADYKARDAHTSASLAMLPSLTTHTPLFKRVEVHPPN